MSGKKYTIMLAMVFVSIAANAQKSVIESGTIEYERKTNLHKLNSDNEWFSRMKDQVGKYHINYFDLSFTNEKSIYKPGKEFTNTSGWFAPACNDNTVFTDLKTQKVTASKKLLEDSFILQDSIHNIKWKITNDYRNFLGFECRKAVGKIFDSVVVVAFYCDQIAPGIGPEGFGGLPGAILGLAIPRMYTTWFATKFTKMDYTNPPVMEAPKKGKIVTPTKLTADLKTAMKDWGNYVNKILWFVLI
ncbi:MAG TPA: GLPGLI family protein [Flavobacteriales bacterium]|nr:GLPGLI family protein [Flavobacteriales bacterium]